MGDHSRHVATTVTGAVHAPDARAPRPGPADVSSAVAAALAEVPTRSATVRVPDRLPPVPIDQGRLERTLAAMVRSAWLRTPPGARVLVQATTAPERPGGPGALQIRVTDRGPDVAAGARPWLHAKPRGPQDLHGTDGGAGRLTVEANPGGGLVHVLTLPLTS
ncbi:hypothetical protein ACFV4G_28525 [Kitasatospora sp. NPDC059747]|uniref:hypothetical protein n=1 Tax=Kitasatospora sp. NPDC059747 TaxID=3346930 RepID=UPI003657CB50